MNWAINLSMTIVIHFEFEKQEEEEEKEGGKRIEGNKQTNK